MCFKYILILIWAISWVDRSESLLEIPLQWHKSPRHSLMEVGLQKHIPISSDPDDIVALYKFMDTEFFANVFVGHPGQSLRLVLDTGWTDSWMMSSVCPLYKLVCQYHTLYNSKLSSTYIPNGKEFNLAVDGGNMTGFLSTDKINLGHSTVENVTFVEVTDIPMIYMFLKADGLLSFNLGDETHVTFVDQLVKSNKMSSSIFSVYINGDKTTPKGGSVLLGGYNERNFDNKTLVYLNTLDSSWNIPMSNFSLIYNPTKNVTYCENGCKVLLDTGSGCIYGPGNDIKVLNMQLGARELYLDRYVIDCGLVPKLPRISFNFNGRAFLFKGPDLVQEVTVWKIGKICLSIFMKHKLASDQWYFGTSFMKRVFTIYDMKNKHVGLASANL